MNFTIDKEQSIQSVNKKVIHGDCVKNFLVGLRYSYQKADHRKVINVDLLSEDHKVTRCMAGGFFYRERKDQLNCRLHKRYTSRIKVLIGVRTEKAQCYQ